MATIFLSVLLLALGMAGIAIKILVKKKTDDFQVLVVVIIH